MVVEFAKYGNLRDFLRDFLRTSSSNLGYERAIGQPVGPEGPHALTHHDLVNFSYQVARGMDYLATKKVKSRIFQ